MAIVFKDYLISLLPDYILENDSYNDGAKGFIVRYLEIFGEELDDYYYAQIEDVVNQSNAILCSNSIYLNYIQAGMGDNNLSIFTEADRRRFLTFLVSIYGVKGREISFIALYRTLGLEASLTYEKYYMLPGESCPICTKYYLTLIGTPTMDAALYLDIVNIKNLVEPIDTELGSLNYNGDDVMAVQIEVINDGMGGLTYDNPDDSSLVVSENSAGQYIITSTISEMYYIENNRIYFIKLVTP